MSWGILWVDRAKLPSASSSEALSDNAKYHNASIRFSAMAAQAAGVVRYLVDGSKLVQLVEALRCPTLV